MSTAEQLTVVKHFLTNCWPHEPGPFVVLFNDGTILASTDDREVLHLGPDGDVLNEWEDEEPSGPHWDCCLNSCESSPKFLFEQDDELYEAIESLRHRAYRDVQSVDLMPIIQRMNVPHQMSDDTQFEPALPLRRNQILYLISENGDMQDEEQPMSLPPRQIAFTVGDLRSLLKDVSDDMPIEVAAVPDATGWTQWILNMIHQDEKKVVLALSEGTCSNDEEDLTFYCDGKKMRPVE